MLKLVNNLEMLVQKTLFYGTTMLLRKRRAHWAVTEVIFRDKELIGTNASKSEAGSQCSVSLCRAAGCALGHSPVLWLHCPSAGAKAPRALCATFPGWQLLP